MGNPFDHAIPLIYKNGNFTPFLPKFTGPQFAVPVSEVAYTSIGFPAPAYIWDMQASSAPLSELINGVDDMVDVSSAGITYGNTSGLPNGETTVKRTTSSTSQLQVADGAVLDVGTNNAVAFGMMLRFESTASTNVILSKALAPGYSFRLNSAGRPWAVIRPVTGGTKSLVGDATADQAINTWHYVIFVLDHRTGVKECKVINASTEFALSTSALDTFSDIGASAGWDTGALAAANTEYASLCAWTGSDVQSLTKELAQAFLDKSGV